MALHLPELSIQADSYENDIKILLKSIKPHWNEEKIGIKKLTGGYSCTTYYVNWENEPDDAITVRVRRLLVTSNINLPIINPNYEVMLVEELAKAGLFAKVYAVFQNGYCYQYIQGKPLANLTDLSKASTDELPVEYIAEKTAELHSLSLEDGRFGKNDFFEHLKTCLTDGYKEKSHIADKDTLLKELNEVIDYTKRFDLKDVLCHGDHNLGNIIWNSEKEKITFIDWELGHVGYQPMDIANFLMFFNMMDMIPASDAEEFQKFAPKRVKDLEKRFIVTYLNTWSRLNNNGLPVTDGEVEDLEQKVSLFGLVCTLYMLILCTALEEIDFVDFPTDSTKMLQKMYEYYWIVKEPTLQKLKLK